MAPNSAFYQFEVPTGISQVRDRILTLVTRAGGRVLMHEETMLVVDVGNADKRGFVVSGGRSRLTCL